MTDPQANLETLDGHPVLRFQRRLSHPPAKVWRAVTEPAELAHWFPALVETEPRIGARMRFTFPDSAPNELAESLTSGEVLEYDEPRVFAFRWHQDVLRFEIVPAATGCVLHFSQTMGGDWVGRLAAGRNAVGWDECLGYLTARLAGEEFQPPTDRLTPLERYIAAFGLDEGTVSPTPGGFEIFFARDLVWRSAEQVWQLLTEKVEPRVGAEPPPRTTNGYVPAGQLTEVELPDHLEYSWLHEGEPAGRVRWRFVPDPELGNRLELRQTIPAHLAGLRATALAAWHVQLELFFAALYGEIRCPWPEERTTELRQRYQRRLD